MVNGRHFPSGLWTLRCRSQVVTRSQNWHLGDGLPQIKQVSFTDMLTQCVTTASDNSKDLLTIEGETLESTWHWQHAVREDTGCDTRLSVSWAECNYLYEESRWALHIFVNMEQRDLLWHLIHVCQNKNWRRSNGNYRTNGFDSLIHMINKRCNEMKSIY